MNKQALPDMSKKSYRSKHHSFACLLMGTMLLSGLTGCAFNSTRVYDGYAVKPMSGDKAQQMRSLFTGSDKPLIPESCFGIVANTDTKTCTEQRNLAVSLLMMESNALCTEHLKSIYGNEAALNISTGTLAAFSSGLAAISTGWQAAALSALSAFSNAERSLVNETVYQNLLTTAIATKIGEMRTTKATALMNHQRLAITKYPAGTAILEIQDYHESCSFMKGLETALKEGSQTTPESKRIRLEAKIEMLKSQILAYTSTRASANESKTKAKDVFLDTLQDQFKQLNQEIKLLSPVSLP